MKPSDKPNGIERRKEKSGSTTVTRCYLTFEGREGTIVDWSTELGVAAQTIAQRIFMKWPLDKVLRRELGATLKSAWPALNSEPYDYDVTAQRYIAKNGRMSREEIAKAMGISRMRVEQIEKSALKKALRTARELGLESHLRSLLSEAS
jgi:hypothetical protein